MFVDVGQMWSEGLELTLNRRLAGQHNFYDGIAAEAVIERQYCADGNEIAARRWRGLSGEIDLVFRKDGEIIFVEVKKAKDFSHAAYRLSQRQLARIASAAEEFVANEALGPLTPFRIDLALVNQRGESLIIENVTM